ncbi:ATP-grasp domain-containing protein [Morganella psychrotolerans]|uniref:ATP-grasp domain-containing protein n=1 Tax=Morganella psychrotolerans TaxID=368603 RepID=UPI0039B0E31D
MFEEEYYFAQKKKIPCLLLHPESAVTGKYQFSGAFKSDIPVIWRGWMLNTEEYQQLHRVIALHGGTMLSSADNYISNHHITGWYECCRKFTPETVITSANANFDELICDLQWPAYFVKDYVKSLTTSRGSIAENADEIREIIKLITHYRGEIEGGICLRHIEYFIENTERRYFVLNKKVYSADSHIPHIVYDIADKINTPFFSVDIAENTAGKLRLIEIGDGQVSDIKEWDTEKFILMLNNY